MRRLPETEMSKRLVPHTCSPAADLLPDDVLLDIFLRLPPEPTHLFVASLICLRWRRLIRDPAFLVRFRAFHRATPVLGFYQNIRDGSRCGIRFVPIADPAPRLSALKEYQNGACRVLDCRHGRVLICDEVFESLFVWDPMAAESFDVGSLPEFSGEENFTAVLVCTPGHDDHTDCHSAPFRIVLVDNSDDDEELLVSVCVFSSETEAWGEWTSISPPSLVSTDSAAVVGGFVYWMLGSDEDNYQDHILGFEMQTRRLDLIELPKEVQEKYKSDIHLMPAEDGGIGFAGVNLSSLHFWSRKTDNEGAAGWALIRIIDMAMLPISHKLAGDMLLWSSVAGFADDSDVLFLHSEAGVFMINLRSKQLKEVPQASDNAIYIYPYTSFYSRGPDIIKDDKDMALKYRKKKMQAAAQVEAVDKEQTESSSSGHQVHKLLTK
ncbi:hypothetical protein SETIT_9G290800v2 [Setaria italica]|uniref:F-box domain-containing protein n=4 Tax=Setaria TaxID=4554 RepID=A0A368SM08_SETIT|nr:hypothetical protein SETIT_9G290800v2 [Setaria italica]TKV94402.1 hypothetical protein SEVIR_9G292400v2 [Setaria viridis]